MAATIIACVVAACGLDLQGSLDVAPDGGVTDPPGANGSDPPTLAPIADAGDEWPAPSNVATCSCALTAPPGFTVVAFAADRNAPCVGDLAPIDVISDPVADPDACSCAACVVTKTPSCLSGNFNSDFDNTTTPTCGTRGLNHPANNGACTAYNGTYARHGRAVPPPPSGPATCTSQAVAKAGGGKGTPVRACAPAGTTCACDPTLASSYRTCLRAAGDVACPPEAPTKKLVGTGTEIACSACSCTLNATCAGSITFYSDSQCQNSLFTITDKACTLEGSGQGGSYSSLKWTGAAETSCALGASAGTASLASPSTICCP